MLREKIKLLSTSAGAFGEGNIKATFLRDKSGIHFCYICSLPETAEKFLLSGAGVGGSRLVLRVKTHPAKVLQQ